MFDFEEIARRREAQEAERVANPGPILHVVNVRDPISTWPVPSMHYVGRFVLRRAELGRSSLGNPYRLTGASDAKRQRVVARYKRWLWSKMQDHRSEQYQELLRILDYSLGLRGVCLACWCAPKACHADVVKAAVEWMWARGVRPLPAVEHDDGWRHEPEPDLAGAWCRNCRRDLSPDGGRLVESKTPGADPARLWQCPVCGHQEPVDLEDDHA